MSKRPYLRTDDRRRHLLEAAVRLLAREGVGGITMVAVAAEAGVSRRLVYDHFADLAALYAALLDDCASRFLEAVDRSAERDGKVDPFTRAFEQLLAMPADDQRVLRLLVAGVGSPDLEPLRTRFRHHVEQRWLSDVPLDQRASAVPVLWTITGGLFSLADMVSRGDVAAADAVEIARALVASAPTLHRRTAASL